MARKGENIFKRKDGRWEARYIKGRELSGRIRYGFCYGRTYKEAKEKVTRYKAALLVGAPVPAASNRHRFAFFCEEWLQLERGRVKASTYVKYNTILTRHILPKLGGCFPLGLTTQLAERFKRELLDEGLSAKTVRDILTVLRSILKYTAKQFPGPFPAVEICYPKEQKTEARVLSQEEQQRFVSYLQTDMDECKFGILLALLTGLRIGELCALRWENVSLRNRTIHVAATMQRLRDFDCTGASKTKVMIGSPKSDTSIRTIPLTENAVRLCGQYDPHRPAAFLLTGTEQFMEPRQVQRMLAKYTKECGLEGVHFHTIRHTFATRCVEAGFELKSLSEILGHSDTSITLNRYIHSSMDMKRENMNKLSAVGL
ncbi:site-specific integrase [uncultured Dysosmobacter sp.]|uniref:tyrosine-type recombinase/integrase n=1 Tax=uncultured Dysosmobacter sp. TaxID=2591384 RepID=UPI002622C8D6|nr:site-specific integrase [uncultured Dysosmobacter sp.]